MQSSIYKATTLSVVLVAALNAGQVTRRSYPATPVYTTTSEVIDSVPVVNPVVIPSTADESYVESVVANADHSYVVYLPAGNFNNGKLLVSINIEDPKKDKEEVTLAQTAKDLAVSIALIAAVTYATEKALEHSFPDKGWKRTTAENVQKAVIAGIGLHWINECAKTNFGKVRAWFSAAADRAINIVQDAAENAKQQTTSAKRAVVKAFKTERY